MAVIRDITERKQAQAALERERRTLTHMLQASDHERQLIAYDIHDGLAQQLAGAMMQFQVYDHLKDTKPARGRRRLMTRGMSHAAAGPRRGPAVDQRRAAADPRRVGRHRRHRPPGPRPGL